MGVVPDFGAEVNGWEDGRGVYPDIMEGISAERGDEGKRVVVKIRDVGDVAEEVALDELFLWNPKFLATIVDDSILVWVAVGSEGAGRGGEEVGGEVG